MRSRNGNNLEIEKPSVSNQGMFVISLRISGTQVTVTRIWRTVPVASDKNWRGRGTVGPKSLSFNYSWECGGPKKWERISGTANLRPEPE